MPLHVDYRPDTLDKVVGNRGVVESHRAIFQRESDWPHAVLYVGPSGCGKTTLARIYAGVVGCHQKDINEINAANNRGIDTAREIQKSMTYSPFYGKVKGYLIDECFSGDTVVRTSKGDVRIDNVKIGDVVYGQNGEDVVERLYKNKVSLGRVVKVNTADGEKVFCSKDHLFWTKEGWKEAGALKGALLLKNFSYNKATIKQQKEAKSAKGMRILWRNFQRVTQASKVLLVSLYEQSKNKTDRSCLWVLRESFFSKAWWKMDKKVLFERVCGKVWPNPPFDHSNTKIPGESQKNSRKQKEIPTKQPRNVGAIKKTGFRQDEKQPLPFVAGKLSQNKRIKKDKWDIKCLAWRAWGQWQNYRTSANACHCLGLADGSCGQNWALPFFRFSLSTELQSGYRESGVKNCHRGRWPWAFNGTRERKGQEENGKTQYVRVESVEVYERGCNDESFKGVIEYKERNQGYVDFYDLGVKNHPSYYTNGFLVHNCGATSKDFQNAMLKALEDAPKHVYFMMATTDPQNLLPTLRNRCMTFEMSLLNHQEMTGLIEGVLKAEGVNDIPEEVIAEISIVSDGCPRQALVILDQIIDIPVQDMMAAVQDLRVSDKNTKDLCQALLKRETWGKVAAILKAMDLTKAEDIRRGVLGYMAAVLLNGDNRQAAMVMEFFREPTYNSGKSGLVWAAYQSIL